MTFHNSEYLFLLFLLIPVIFWYLWEMHKSDASLQTSSFVDVDRSIVSWKLRIRHLPFVLRVLAIALLIIAVARPQTSSSWQSTTTEGIDIVMAMDISGSMQIEDLKPNRIEAAKAVATDFIMSRPNDNIGLVVFAAESFTQCPLTTDHRVLINMMNGVKFGIIEDGTAIGLSLANAVSNIKESKAKSKVVILLTDGSNNSGDISPMTAAEIAKTFGIRVYAIGVGTHGVVEYPIQTPFGVRYQQVKSEFDEKTLKEIADMTGGEYFSATNNKRLREVYREIDKLEKSKINIKEFSNKTEGYAIFTVLAFTLLLIEVLIKSTWLRAQP